MGYRKVPVVHTLEFEEYEGLVVRMLGLKVGKMRRLLQLTDDSDDRTDEFIDEMFDLVVGGLVSWTLEDEQGHPLPADREQVEDLDFDMLQAILGAWLDKLTGVSADLGKDSPSGERFPGQPLTMEAL